MFLVLFIVIAALGIPLNVIATVMHFRVNSVLPEGRRISWWARNFREVNRAYRQYFPDSVLPDIDQYGGYAVWGLLAALIVVGVFIRD